MGIRITSFIKQVGPLAAKEMERTGISAALMTALAIKGCCNGRQDYARDYNALFLIPAGNWRGATFKKRIGQYYFGSYTFKYVKFRAYDSWEESMHDFANYLVANHPDLIGVEDYREAVHIIIRDRYRITKIEETVLTDLISMHGLTRFDVSRGTG